MARTIETLLMRAQVLRAQLVQLKVSGQQHLMPRWHREIARLERRARVLQQRKESVR